jgi:hypothetical protein
MAAAPPLLVRDKDGIVRWGAPTHDAGSAAAGSHSTHCAGRGQERPKGGDPGQGLGGDAQHLGGGRAGVHYRKEAE